MSRFPENVEERMARTCGVVEGDPFWAWEQLSTESRWQLAGAARLNRYRWVKISPGSTSRSANSPEILSVSSYHGRSSGASRSCSGALPRKSLIIA